MSTPAKTLDHAEQRYRDGDFHMGADLVWQAAYNAIEAAAQQLGMPCHSEAQAYAVAACLDRSKPGGYAPPPVPQPLGCPPPPSQLYRFPVRLALGPVGLHRQPAGHPGHNRTHFRRPRQTIAVTPITLTLRTQSVDPPIHGNHENAPRVPATGFHHTGPGFHQFPSQIPVLHGPPALIQNKPGPVATKDLVPFLLHHVTSDYGPRHVKAGKNVDPNRIVSPFPTPILDRLDPILRPVTLMQMSDGQHQRRRLVFVKKVQHTSRTGYLRAAASSNATARSTASTEIS